MTDDQITDAIAAEIVQRVESAHPQLSPRFRRQLVSLYTRQALGVLPPPGKIKNKQLAHALGHDPKRLSEEFTQALAHAWLAYQERFPELL